MLESLHRFGETFISLYHLNIVGLEVGGVETLSMYADDVIFFFKKSEDSVPLLFHLVSSFGKMSGYTISLSKSDFMPL